MTRMLRWVATVLLVSAGVSASPLAHGPLRGPAIDEASRQVLPRYPPQQQRQGIGGTSVVQVEVDATGAARAVTIRLSSGNSGLDRAAVRHVERLRFVPAVRRGAAIDGIVLVPVNFTPLDSAVADGTRAMRVAPELRPAFECASAVGESERALCRQAGLRPSELTLRDTYARALVSSPEPAVRSLVIEGHRGWLADRNRRCGADPCCLARDSRDRTRYLRVLAGLAE